MAAMLHVGAQGATRQELTRLLHWSNVPIGPSVKSLWQQLFEHGQLVMSNSVWVKQGFTIKPPFQHSLTKQFYAHAQTVDFNHQQQVMATINANVKHHTHGMINRLLSKPLSTQTVLAMVNTVFFQGVWLHPFSELNLMPFFVAGKAPKLRYMMHQTNQFAYAKIKHLQIVVMPYKNQRFSLWIILPDDAKAKLQPIINRLSNQAVTVWQHALHQEKVLLAVPKFDITSRIDLIPTFQALGVKDAFEARLANFKGISSQPGLHVSTLLQQARIQVNEKGTKASAATLSAMNLMAVAVQPVNGVRFNADHPFIFILRDNKTGTNLFIGQVMDPNSY